jgi:thioesterase domain-containing protein
LGTERPLYGIQARGLSDDEAPDDQIETMAARYVEALRRVQPSGPYLLCGYSLGGLVAFEMAQQLLRGGDGVALLALLDGFFPASHELEYKRWVLVELIQMLHPDGSSRADLRSLGWSELMECHVEAMLRNAGGAFSESTRRLAALHGHALESYAPRTYSGKITYFRSVDQPREYPFGEAMEPCGALHQPIGAYSSEPVELYEVPGNHFTMLQEPHVRILAERLKECLRKAA